MHKQTYAVVVVAGALAGCGGASGSVPSAPAASPSEPRPAVLTVPALAEPANKASIEVTMPRVQSRTEERDDDADGIPDYRVIITESFDAEGHLESVTRERDFEADGVIDSRVMTRLR